MSSIFVTQSVRREGLPFNKYVDLSEKLYFECFLEM